MLAGLSFCNFPNNLRLTLCSDIMTDAGLPVSRPKSELEALVKENGGAIFQSENAKKGIIVIAERGSLACSYLIITELVKVAALKKRATHDILRPQWLVQSIDMGFVLPIEPR